MENIEIGQEIIIQLKVVVTAINSGHGLCYKLELPQNDYSELRFIWLDVDEINIINPVRKPQLP